MAKNVTEKIFKMCDGNNDNKISMDELTELFLMMLAFKRRGNAT